MKERRLALISPWPPSLDLLHSARADEMKSDEGGEGGGMGRERRSVGGGGEPPAKSLLTLNSLVSQPLQ